MVVKLRKQHNGSLFELQNKSNQSFHMCKSIAKNCTKSLETEYKLVVRVIWFESKPKPVYRRIVMNSIPEVVTIRDWA